MVSTSKEQRHPWKIWGAIATLVIAVVATFFLTRPAETAVSYTPLSGLITLKAMAAKAVPYEVAIAAPKPTLIEFYADWCTTCQAMSSTIDTLHQQYAEQLNFVMLNIDEPQWASQVAEYGASGVPQFTLLDSAHHEVESFVGKVPKPVFKDLFARVIG
ncbi:MAG: thioredoxin domain-containing protein [Cyanobacteria bacterium P01_D01_bin.44]